MVYCDNDNVWAPDNLFVKGTYYSPILKKANDFLKPGYFNIVIPLYVCLCACMFDV